MSRDPRLYLADIVSYAADVLEFVDGFTQEKLIADRRTWFAVLHALEVIGEAAKKLPPELCARAPLVPWRAIAGFRDQLAHAYHDVDPGVVWQVVSQELAPLRDAAASLLADADRQQRDE